MKPNERCRARRGLWPLQLAWMLAAVLVAAQALGLAHRMLHGAGPAGVHAALAHAHDEQCEPGEQARPDQPGQVPGQPGLHDPWSTDAAQAREPFSEHLPGSEQCRLLDHAAQADALAAALPMPALAPANTQGARPALRPLMGGSAAGYHARGPPPAALTQLQLPQRG
ncbi:MAG: hypothetical protein JNL30_16155 [Rubrivivax sp.]|nr:hypothetical protein [Rubrivivax sp.]